jgi:hypothetical protein
MDSHQTNRESVGILSMAGRLLLVLLSLGALYAHVFHRFFLRSVQKRRLEKALAKRHRPCSETERFSLKGEEYLANSEAKST